METGGTGMISQAVELFDQEKYPEAFKAFVEAYCQSQDSSGRQEIFQILEEAYYRPNQEEMRRNYESNVALLKKYPYFWNKAFRRFEALSVQLFPVDDGLYYCYNREDDRFFGIYDAESEHQMRCFFEDMNQPVRVTDEDNIYNLTFLTDNVRSSEDFAGDNHIYLFYTSMEPLERLMAACNLEPVLRQQKLVFLIGEKNWSRYPINFRKKFGVDYGGMSPMPIRIEEVKRICFWYKHAHSGTVFSLGVLGANSHIQSISGYDFHTFSTLDGKVLYFTPEFKVALSEIDRAYTVEQILEIVRSERYSIRIADLEDYLNWLKKRQPEPRSYSVKELFCGYFLFHYEQRNLNPRVVPMLLFDPHMWDPSVYSNMVRAFPYHTVLTCVREPIMRFARSYLVGIAGWDKFQTQYLLAMDYCNTQFLHPELLEHYYGYRFEDMKTKPETVCRAVCKHLNIPYESQMLKAEAPMKDNRTGKVTKGFDTAPLRRDISQVFSEFDQLRLKMFYEPIHRYYGYPTFSSEEYPLREGTVRELFQYPFRFEHTNHKMFQNAPSQEDLHKWIQDILQGAWRKKFTPPRLIPLEEVPNE